MSTDHHDEDPGAPKRRRRRSWTLEEKRRIVDESLEVGASIAEVARIYGDADKGRYVVTSVAPAK